MRALPVCSLLGLAYVLPGLIALLLRAPSTTPHRRSHEQDHKHDCNSHHDHDGTGANREHAHERPTAMSKGYLPDATDREVHQDPRGSATGLASERMSGWCLPRPGRQIERLTFGDTLAEFLVTFDLRIELGAK